MSRAPALPRGWQNWPRPQLEELLSGLETLAEERSSGKGPWLCDIPDCDGRPHKGRRNPHSRADQRAPVDVDWDHWLLLAGRGFGKTRTGAEWVLTQARTQPRGALVGATAADVRDVMVEGESGILACAKATFRPQYEPSKRRLIYPNGAVQLCFSADEPDRMRGPQYFYGWADECAAWRRLQMAWDMLVMGMRLGEHPRICITTTPRPLPLIKEWVTSDRVRTVRGSTYANLHNLAPTFARTVLDRYAGTELGRQELDAEILEDIAGALVARRHIRYADTAPTLDLVVIGVDPAGTGTGDEAGIVAVGRGRDDGLVYVLDDRSKQMSARETGLTAWRAFYDHGAAYIVYEDNFGKQWLRDGLVDAYADLHSLDAHEREEIRRTESGPFPLLRKVNAQHGKVLRAQPVAMRYEQGKVVHVGQHGKLEDSLTTWDPHTSKDSPDRIDAMVHAVTFLLRREKAAGSIALPHAAGLGRARGTTRIGRTA